MFDLGDAALSGPVLDCPGGPGSFVAEATERGIDATAADIMYELPPAALAGRCREDYAAVVEQLPEKRELFTWEFYGSVEERAQLLERAYRRFLEDYPAGRRDGRYVYADLPTLPFPDDSFSLVLSAHFLFLYGDRLSQEFHRQTIEELLRVATGEVRLFPLVGLDTERYDRLDELIAHFREAGHAVEIRSVPFEFQKGATEMFVVSA